MTPAEEDALMDQLGIPLHSRGSHRKVIRAAVAHERERAAKVCDQLGKLKSASAEECAAAIRRGEP